MKFTQKEKMNKRQRLEMNKANRVTWNFSPVTRVKPSAKIYNRRKIYD